MYLQMLTPYLPYITLASALCSILCLILVIVALSSNGRLKRRLQRWKEINSTADLEEVFERTTQSVAAMRQQLIEMESALEKMQDELKQKVSTPVMRRYNAFAEVGSDLSYSVAFLDDAGDGVVLTSIYGRDDSVTYGKPIQNGSSDYTLTSEEQAVIQSVIHHSEADVNVKTL